MTIEMDFEGNSIVNNGDLTLIRYPRFKEIHDLIKECQILSRLGNEPQCISLEGVTGAGKTTLAKDYVSFYPPLETTEGMEYPVFYVETPSPVNVKSMASSMLHKLGDPVYDRGNLPSMNDRLVNLIRDCKVELVIIDEFQHLIDADTDRVLATVSDWLKSVVKQTGVPFMVVGIQGKVERILDANPQLSRLFASRMTLDPIPWNLSDERAISIMHDFVAVVEESVMMMALTKDLPRSELLHRIHYATDGVIGNLMNLARKAVRIARKKEFETVNLFALQQAFDERLASHFKQKVNPFAVPQDEIFVPPERKRYDRENSTGKRSFRKKGRSPAISEMLVTH